MRKLLIAVVLLGVIAVVGDRVAEHVAEDQVAGVVKDREGLSTEPDVDVAGFPFLTQVLSNDIAKVTLSLPEVEAKAGDTEEIRVEDVHVAFTHVRTSDHFHQATAQRMTGSALIPYDAVSDLGPFTASYGGRGGQEVGVITLTPDAEQGLASGGAFDVGVAAHDGRVTFLGTDGTTRVATIPKNLKPTLSTLLEVPHPLYGLPQSFTIERLRVTRDGIALVLSGQDVEVTR